MRSENEDGILACILADPGVLDFEAIEEDLFAYGPARQVFQAAKGLREAGQPITLLTIRDAIGDAAPVAYLGSLSPVTGATAPYYIGRLQEARARRELRRLALQLTDDLQNRKEANEILASLEEQLLSLRRRSSEQREIDLQDAIQEVISNAERRMLEHREGPSGVETGFRDLDRLLGGLQPGALVIIAARTSKGKTALALSMADFQIRAGIPIAFASLEMSGAQVVERILCARGDVPSSRLRFGALGGDDFRALLAVAGELSTQPLFILDQPALTVRGLRAWGHRVVTKGARVLFLDYMGLLNLEHDERPRWEAMAAVSRGVKTLARELKIPVVALVQLNRTAANDEQLGLHMLRDSGAIEQDADVVILLDRSEGVDEDSDSVPAVLNVAKHRSGPTGRVKVLFRKSTARFREA